MLQALLGKLGSSVFGSGSEGAIGQIVEHYTGKQLNATELEKMRIELQGEAMRNVALEVAKEEAILVGQLEVNKVEAASPSKFKTW